MTPVYIFILVELLDILTTGIGISMGLTEINPIGISLEVLVTKLIVIFCVAEILHLKKRRKIDWVIPIVAGIPTTWNLLVISMEMIIE